MKAETVECMREWSDWMKKGCPKLRTELQIFKQEQEEYRKAWNELLKNENTEKT